MTVARTLPRLLAERLAADATGPLVTFYDDATGERTELSAVTFDNWVAKTANLLVDELGVGHGDDAVLALPLHWQSFVVAAGCWTAGMTVRFEGAADVAFAMEGGTRPAADEVVVLSLRPLGAGLATPDGSVTDFATEVRVHGDRFTGQRPGGDDEALPGVTHAQLAATDGSPERVLIAADGDPPLDSAWLRRAYVEPLAGGGSVVLCRHADPTLLPRRREAERADVEQRSRCDPGLRSRS